MLQVEDDAAGVESIDPTGAGSCPVANAILGNEKAGLRERICPNTPKTEKVNLRDDTCPMASFRVPENYKNHPGGQALLKSGVGAGSNISALLFLTYHIGRDLDGKIAAAARAMNCPLPEHGTIYNELHELVRKVRQDHPMQHVIFIVWCLFLTVCILVCFVLWLVQPSFLVGLLTAVVFECYFLNIFHTRHHKGGKLFDVKVLDKLTSPLYDFVDSTWGYYPPAWWINHHINHHLHTNDLQIDPDIPDTHPLVRMSEDQPKFWYNKFQTFYWPLLLPFSIARFPIQNVLKFNGGIGPFLAWFALMFVLPYYLHGNYGLIQTAFLQGLTGCLLTNKFAVSHTHGDLGSKGTGNVETMTDIDDFIKGQVEESMSWGGYFSCLLWGGINMQIEHHLCPALDPPLYYFIQPELRRICKKHGIRYTEEPSIVHAIWAFHVQLWRMG